MNLDEIRQKIKALQCEAEALKCIDALKDPGVISIGVCVDIGGDDSYFTFTSEALKNGLIDLLNTKLWRPK